MKRNFKKIIFFLLLLFFVGMFLCYSIYDRTKMEFMKSNSMIVGSILSRHPELEKEIILALENFDGGDYGTAILEKYGFNSLKSSDYLSSLKQYRNIFFGTFLIFYLILIFLFSSFYILFERNRKKEILKIDRYLFSLLSEDIQVDLKDFQSGELANLQNDLMKVTSRLKNALEHSTKEQQELSKTLADISHQLKTPLTSLLIINEALSNSNMDKDTRERFLKKQEEVITHMQTLIVTLLKVSQIESGMVELKREKIDMGVLLTDTLEELDLLFVSKNIYIDKKVLENVFIVGDYIWVKEAILNILKNAVEHSNQNGKILLRVSENPMYVELMIQDYGCGIKNADLPHIFERFYKSNANKDSIGIGLNLAKSILDRTNATIRVKSKEGVGTTFLIHFYKGVV